LAVIGHINQTIDISIKPFQPSQCLTTLDAIPLFVLGDHGVRLFQTR